MKVKGSPSNRNPLKLGLGVVLVVMGIGMLVNGIRGLFDEKVKLITPRGSIYVEVADTEEERQTGLMYRKELSEGHGMLFKFETNDSAGCFWMKNTYVPLDMVWLDDKKQVISIHENATPLSEKPICPKQNGAYVIEVNAGEARRLGVAEGVTIRF